MEQAIESLRKQGQAAVAKRAGRVAKQGKISIVADASGAIAYEVNAETDFVAKNEDFVSFVEVAREAAFGPKTHRRGRSEKIDMPGIFRA